MHLTLFIFVFTILFSNKAFAYLDGGTGAMILQFILAAIAGIVAYIGITVDRFKKFFKKIFKR